MLRPEFLREIESYLTSQRDRDFLRRTYAKQSDYYVQKLIGLRFANLGNVLDAGSGFGQWSIALGKLNERAIGIDIHPQRIKSSRAIADENNSKNVNFFYSAGENLPFINNYFDGIFSYSVVYSTDYLRSFSEFFRVLKPGGRVYICTNSLGWYLYNLAHNHNPSTDFWPRAYAIETLFHTLKYKVTGRRTVGKSLVMSPKNSRAGLIKSGFQNIIELPANFNNDYSIKPIQIYPKQYLGLISVYELIAIK